MQQELRGLKLEVLSSMHHQAHNRLHKSMYGGASRQEISQQQDILNELTIAINNKLRRQLKDPAAEQRHYTAAISQRICLKP